MTVLLLISRSVLAGYPMSVKHTEQAPKRMMVLGGGNTAMDCCRTAKRLAATEVTVLVRSSYEAIKAIQDIEHHKQKGEILTGLFYLDPTRENFHEINHTCETPLNKLPQDMLCPGVRVLGC